MRIKSGTAEWEDERPIMVAGRAVHPLNDWSLSGYPCEIIGDYVRDPRSVSDPVRYVLIELEDSRLFVAKPEQLDTDD